jgi:hypothetical protein
MNERDLALCTLGAWQVKLRRRVDETMVGRNQTGFFCPENINPKANCKHN